MLFSKVTCRRHISDSWRSADEGRIANVSISYATRPVLMTILRALDNAAVRDPMEADIDMESNFVAGTDL